LSCKQYDIRLPCLNLSIWEWIVSSIQGLRSKNRKEEVGENQHQHTIVKKTQKKSRFHQENGLASFDFFGITD
jgi:hypothetical protein